MQFTILTLVKLNVKRFLRKHLDFTIFDKKCAFISRIAMKKPLQNETRFAPTAKKSRSKLTGTLVSGKEEINGGGL